MLGSSGNLLTGGTSGTLPLSVAGYLVTLNDVTLSNVTSGTVAASTFTNYSGGNLTGTITDTSGNQLTLYYWPTSYSSAAANLYNDVIPTTPVNVTGFVSVYPGSLAEFSPISIVNYPSGTPLTQAPEPGTLALLGAGAAVGAVVVMRRRLNRKLGK